MSYIILYTKEKILDIYFFIFLQKIIFSFYKDKIRDETLARKQTRAFRTRSIVQR